MERLNDRSVKRPSGISANGIRIWGLVLLAASLIGRSLIQFRIFGVGSATAEELLAIMGESQKMMYLAAISVILQACEAGAAVIFAFLMAEGAQKTSDMKAYVVRVAMIAVLSEIPYNLALSGKAIDLSSRNPVFGLVVGLATLWFYKLYPGLNGKHLLSKIVATVGAYLWCAMLNISHGICVVFIGLILWAFQKKHQMRIYAGALVAILCSLISPFYMAAPIVFLLLHAYNGDKGESNRVINYLSYPVMLIVVTLIGVFAF